MKKSVMAICCLWLAGCSGTRLILVNTSGKPIKEIEIKLADQSTLVPRLADGESHSQDIKVKVETPLSVNVNYLDGDGRKHYASSPIDLKKGDGGALRLSVTAKGTLEAVKTK